MVETDKRPTALRDFLNRRKEKTALHDPEDYRWNQDAELFQTELKPKNLLLAKMPD